MYMWSAASGEPAGHANKEKKLDRTINWRGYLQGILLVAIATSIAKLIQPLFTPTTIMALYVLAVGITAYLGGFRAFDYGIRGRSFSL